MQGYQEAERDTEAVTILAAGENREIAERILNAEAEKQAESQVQDEPAKTLPAEFMAEIIRVMEDYRKRRNIGHGDAICFIAEI
jgi:hypothetical protein